MLSPQSEPSDGASQKTQSSALRQVQIRNLQRELLRIEISAITKHNDRKLIVREALNDRAKANGFSVVPHALVIVVGIEKPAEAVGSGSPIRMVGLTLGRIDRAQSWLHLGFTEQIVVAQSTVPLLQILER